MVAHCTDSLWDGAFANHALWVLVHECTHNLIFRNTAMNRWMAIIANLPMVVPATVNFAIYHIKHHKFLGDCEHDPDVAPPWEGQLLQGGFFGRLLWQMLFPILLDRDLALYRIARRSEQPESSTL